MILKKSMLLAMILLSLAACAPNTLVQSDFCHIYHPVFMSAKDTDDTKRQTDLNNVAYDRLCK